MCVEFANGITKNFKMQIIFTIKIHAQNSIVRSHDTIPVHKTYNPTSFSFNSCLQLKLYILVFNTCKRPNHWQTDPHHITEHVSTSQQLTHIRYAINYPQHIKKKKKAEIRLGAKPGHRLQRNLENF